MDLFSWFNDIMRTFGDKHVVIEDELVWHRFQIGRSFIQIHLTRGSLVKKLIYSGTFEQNNSEILNFVPDGLHDEINALLNQALESGFII